MTSLEQAIQLFEGNDLIGLAMEAEHVRKRLDHHKIITYCTEAAAPSYIELQRADSIQQTMNRLDAVRESGATAVMPRFDEPVTAVEYLKTLALTRIYLDSVPHVQTTWTIGLKICQIALRFGADDIAGDENERHRPTEEQLRCLIRDAGFVPKQRDALFRTYYLD